MPVQTRETRSSYSVKKINQDSDHFNEFCEFTTQLYAGDPFYVAKPVFTGPLPAMFFLVYRDDELTGRAAALVNPVISFNNQKTGLISYYECVDDPLASKALFDAVLDHHQSSGIDVVIGPLNGTTWNSYRVTTPDDDIPFFLDNYNKDYYSRQFEDYGFDVVASYFSAKANNLEADYSRVDRFHKIFLKKGITIRPVDTERFEDDLRKVHDLSLEGFKNNFLYSDIPFEIFAAMYESIKRYMNPDYVLLAEDDNGVLLGFIFAVDNLYEKSKRSLVIKTVAIRPDSRSRGLGTLLVEKIYKQAFESAYDQVIHALMYQGNESMNIKTDAAQVFRTYHLYGKSVSGEGKVS